MLAQATRIARIDAGPAAIAFTPRRDATLPAGVGLAPRNDRWIAKEAIADPHERAHGVTALLAAIADAAA